ncbi:methyltransferase domain-containing protein [Bradyrhizobium sp. Gha]|uniref:methyltransferase domain-containing protein n=1 Tax=Bradyrhizobium sp. Gha TaxID=1855318 RepID=UPI0008E9B127|nr:methyltransferase domain-containing protein [Bradyrhizobium sp. Gha]SFH65800.1 23S rRNA G2445 N2-methylase RlmL [Bradyrhizobium sp. Gha]
MPSPQGQPERARGGARHRRATSSTPQTPIFLARSVRGLEWLAAAEIKSGLNASVLAIGHREIIFSAALDSRVLALGSIDDLFLLCGRIEEIDRGRISLAKLAAGVRKLPLARALARVGRLRPIHRSSGFEVIASFLGRRNYKRTEIEVCTGAVISEVTGMAFHDHETDAAPERDVSWRIHIRDGEAMVGLRVALRPLHRRAYRMSSAPGALHPPVAYAMSMLSGAYPGCNVLDPCCGTGTLLIEARRLMPDIITIGSDIDRDRLLAAARNGGGARCQWIQADLGRLPYRNGFADCVVANLPWGRSVAAKGAIKGNMSMAVAEAMRVLAPGGNAVLLTSLGEKLVSDRVLWSIPIRLAGHWANIQILSAESGKPPACFQRRYGPSLRHMWTQFGASPP